MEIRYLERDSILITTLAGRLETSVAAQVEESLLGKVADGFENVVLDLSETEYISSAGLRVLLVAAKKIGQHRGTFRLCRANAENLQVLEMVGFLNIIEYADSLDEALAR